MLFVVQPDFQDQPDWNVILGADTVVVSRFQNKQCMFMKILNEKGFQ